MERTLVKLSGPLLLSVLAMTPSCRGQDAPTPAIGTTVSALSNKLRGIFQDSRGNHWFGTDGQGVDRYDGTTITRFTTKDGLGHDLVKGIQEDKAGNVYFKTEHYALNPYVGTTGITKFDGRTFTALSVPATPSAMTEWKLQPDDLWFSGNQDSHAVFRYDGTTVHRLEFPRTDAGDAYLAKYPRSRYPNIKSSPYDVYTIFKDSKGNVWFGTQSLGACRFDGKAFAWISEDTLEYGAMLSGDQSFGVRSFLEGDDGKFWFSNVRNRFDVVPNEAAGEGDPPIRFVKEKGPGDSRFDLFQSSVKDAHGAFWMSTWGDGVWRYDGKELTHYPVTEGDAAVLLISIHQDRDGTLWLATHEAGPYRFNGTTFEKFRP